MDVWNQPPEKTSFDDDLLRKHSWSGSGELQTKMSVSATNSEQIQLYARMNMAARHETFKITVIEGGPSIFELILDPMNRKPVIFIFALIIGFSTCISCMCCFAYKVCLFKPKPLPELDLDDADDKNTKAKKDPNIFYETKDPQDFELAKIGKK